MFQSKVISVTTIIIFIFTIALVNCALAGEKLKYHGTGFTTDWQQTEVGDVEGHILGIQKTTQVFNEIFLQASQKVIGFGPKTGPEMLNLNSLVPLLHYYQETSQNLSLRPAVL